MKKCIHGINLKKYVCVDCETIPRMEVGRMVKPEPKYKMVDVRTEGTTSTCSPCKHVAATCSMVKN